MAGERQAKLTAKRASLVQRATQVVAKVEQLKQKEQDIAKMIADIDAELAKPEKQTITAGDVGTLKV